eukprot:SAG31_NODE_1239_length_9169_cov_18.922492_2_plen_86_part_00
MVSVATGEKVVFEPLAIFGCSFNMHEFVFNSNYGPDRRRQKIRICIPVEHSQSAVHTNDFFSMETECRPQMRSQSFNVGRVITRT